MVNERENTNSPQRTILAALGTDSPNQLYAVDAGDEGAGVSGWVLGLSRGEEAPTVELTQHFRDPETKFWRCTNARAQAQAVAREAEHLIASRSEEHTSELQS